MLRGLLHLLKAFLCALELQALVQPVQAVQGLLDILFKLCVVKAHFHNALVHFLAHFVTSFHNSSRMASNTGFMAGLM